MGEPEQQEAESSAPAAGPRSLRWPIIGWLALVILIVGLLVGPAIYYRIASGGSLFETNDERIAREIKEDADRAQAQLGATIEQLNEAQTTGGFESSMLEGEWRELARFKGGSTTQTEAFTCNKEWVIDWAYASADEDHFSIWIIDAETGENVDLVVNEIGSKSSSVFHVYRAGTFALKITTDANFEVVIQTRQ